MATATLYRTRTDTGFTAPIFDPAPLDRTPLMLAPTDAQTAPIPAPTRAPAPAATTTADTATAPADPWISFGQLVAGVLGASAQPSTQAPTVAAIPTAGTSGGGGMSNRTIGALVVVLLIAGGAWWWYRKRQRAGGGQ